MRRDEIEHGDEVFCTSCKENTTAKLIDIGYGPTEFWGSFSNHVDLVLACCDCESEEIVRPEDVEADDCEEEAA